MALPLGCGDSSFWAEVYSNHSLSQAQGPSKVSRRHQLAFFGFCQHPSAAENAALIGARVTETQHMLQLGQTSQDWNVLRGLASAV